MITWFMEECTKGQKEFVPECILALPVWHFLSGTCKPGISIRTSARCRETEWFGLQASLMDSINTFREQLKNIKTFDVHR